MPSTLRIWDLPTRLFHWALVVCVLGAFVTVKLGGLYMEWHVRFGLATAGLILFRVLWGLFGSRYARFSQFLRGPRALAAYLGGRLRTAGHNPLGALSVIAMLLAFGFQAVSGLFASDDIMIQGLPEISLTRPRGRGQRAFCCQRSLVSQQGLTKQ
jgi:cytochrome b